MAPEKPLDPDAIILPPEAPSHNRHTRRAATALTRRMLRAGEVVRTSAWGSQKSIEARVRFAALNRKAVALIT